MKSNELRIGNWINDGYGCSIEVISIESEKVRNGGPSVNDMCPSWYKPILLNEEWLVKFGFEDVETGRPYINISNGRIVIPLKNTDVIGYIEVDYNADHSLGFSGGVAYFMTEIKHVHQLQNLYFALTGEELKLKQ